MTDEEFTRLWERANPPEYHKVRVRYAGALRFQTIVVEAQTPDEATAKAFKKNSSIVETMYVGRASKEEMTRD